MCPDEIVMIFKLDFYRLGIGPGTDDEKNTEEEVRFLWEPIKIVMITTIIMIITIISTEGALRPLTCDNQSRPIPTYI